MGLQLDKRGLLSRLLTFQAITALQPVACRGLFSESTPGLPLQAGRRDGNHANPALCMLFRKFPPISLFGSGRPGFFGGDISGPI